MKDSALTLTKALPNTAANNNTAALDFNPEATGFLTNQWRQGYIALSIPALADHTNTSVSNLFTLQDSTDNGNFANTNPLVQVSVVGVVSTGSLATVKKVPLVPGIRRYVRFNQAIPANGGNGNNASISYELVV